MRRAEGFVEALFAETLPRAATAVETPSLDTLVQTATFPEISGSKWSVQGG
jgi:hypothetical protein